MDAMSDSSIQSPERLRAQAVAALVPFFIDGPNSDVKIARLAAEGLLDDYKAATPKELQLATQIIAGSFAVNPVAVPLSEVERVWAAPGVPGQRVVIVPNSPTGETVDSS